jgi:hypothetical protein
MALCVAVLAACGADPPQTASEEPERISVDYPYAGTEEGVLRGQSVRVTPGEWVLGTFEPSLRMTFGEGWTLRMDEADYTYLELTDRFGAPSLSLMRPARVGDEGAEPFPDPVGALRTVDGVDEITTIGTTSVAGHDATVFEFTVELGQDHVDVCGPFACVPGFGFAADGLEEDYVLIGGYRYRVWAVTAADPPFLVVAEASAPIFDEVLEIVEPMVESLAPA